MPRNKNPRFPKGPPKPRGPFVAPHHVKDTIDLTDDSAPAIGSWQPATPSAANRPAATVMNRAGNKTGQPNRPGNVQKKEVNTTVTKPSATAAPTTSDDGGIKWELNKLDDDEKEDLTVVPVSETKQESPQIKLTIQPKKVPPLNTKPAPAFVSESRWKPVTDKNTTQIAPTFVETYKNNPKTAGMAKMTATFVETVVQNQPNNVTVKVENVETVNSPKIASSSNTVGSKNIPKTAPEKNSSTNKKATNTQQQAPKATNTQQQAPKATNTQQQAPKATNTQQQAPKAKQAQQQAPKATQAQKAIKITSIGGDAPKSYSKAPSMPHPAGVPKSFLMEHSWKMNQIMPQAPALLANQPIFETNTNRTLRILQPTKQQNQQQETMLKQQPKHPAQSQQPQQMMFSQQTYPVQPQEQQQMMFNQQTYPAQSQQPQQIMFNQQNYPAQPPQQQQQMIFNQQTVYPAQPPQQQHMLFNQQIPHPVQSLQQQQQIMLNQQQLLMDTSAAPTERQQYSPSDVYDESTAHVQQQEPEEDRESSDISSGQKRLSAFQRLGPVSKIPKLTINLTCDKEQSVREVRELEEIIPVHLRQDIIDSKDEVVASFRRCWPWKTALIPHRTVSARNSKSVMLLEQEQMEEIYDRDSLFIQVSVKCYPAHWTKEDVLDALLEGVEGKSFIPCFTEFNREECKFLVIRSKPALVTLHKLGFSVRKDEDVILKVSISKVDYTLHSADFLPRLVLRKILSSRYDSERCLDLSAFTLKSDISHFIYFPLNRLFNQLELVQLQTAVVWEYLTDLNLSHNRLTAIEGFELQKMTPRLKNLDLSHNYLERATCLLRCTCIALKTLKLEGNPLCHDFTDPDHYVRVVKMMFPALVEIDGVPIKLKGDLPRIQRNYCPVEAQPVVEKLLEVFFTLLDVSDPSHRVDMEDLYDDNATLTVTYEYKMRYNPSCRYYRNLFLKASVFKERELHAIEGATAIAKHLCKWPAVMHDANSFTVDVMHHSETTTILRISGIMKLTVDTLAEDEYMLAFTRTLVLTCTDGVEYRILNEMVYWETPSKESIDAAFKVNTVRWKRPSLKLDSAPSDDFKNELTKIFMKLTKLDRLQSMKCLETKEWHLRNALEYFTKLSKLDGFNSLLDAGQDMAPRVQRV